MLSFVNDYSQGAHEAILNRLLQINPETIARGTGQTITARVRRKNPRGL